jgi:hypothetical protein
LDAAQTHEKNPGTKRRKLRNNTREIYNFSPSHKKSSLDEALFSRIPNKKLLQQQQQQQRVSQRKRRRYWTTASSEHGRRGAAVGDIAKEDWEYLLITTIYNEYISRSPHLKSPLIATDKATWNIQLSIIGAAE